MRKEIHKVEVGDLVKRRVIAIPRPEIFLVLDVRGDYPGNPRKTHAMTLKLWEVSAPIDHVSYVPMNLCEVAGGN